MAVPTTYGQLEGLLGRRVPRRKPYFDPETLLARYALRDRIAAEEAARAQEKEIREEDIALGYTGIEEAKKTAQLGRELETELFEKGEAQSAEQFAADLAAKEKATKEAEKLGISQLGVTAGLGALEIQAAREGWPFGKAAAETVTPATVAPTITGLTPAVTPTVAALGGLGAEGFVPVSGTLAATGGAGAGTAAPAAYYGGMSVAEAGGVTGAGTAVPAAGTTGLTGSTLGLTSGAAMVAAILGLGIKKSLGREQQQFDWTEMPDVEEARRRGLYGEAQREWIAGQGETELAPALAKYYQQQARAFKPTWDVSTGYSEFTPKPPQWQPPWATRGKLDISKPVSAYGKKAFQDISVYGGRDR